MTGETREKSELSTPRLSRTSRASRAQSLALAAVDHRQLARIFCFLLNA
jgi:hypothetical protein